MIKSIQTQLNGFAAILWSYFEQCCVVDIIDDQVPLDSRRKVLTHGKACIAMVTGIIF